MKLSWQQSLKTIQRSLPERPLRTAIVGIGHELRGDDAAGIAVVQQLRKTGDWQLETDTIATYQSPTASFLLLEGGHAPENFTGPIRRFAPQLVLLVDAAFMSETPGTIRLIPWQQTTGLSATTHTMPPYMLAEYLVHELPCQVALLGIQPQQLDLDTPMSLPVLQAVAVIAQELTAILSFLESDQMPITAG